MPVSAIRRIRSDLTCSTISSVRTTVRWASKRGYGYPGIRPSPEQAASRSMIVPDRGRGGLHREVDFQRGLCPGVQAGDVHLPVLPPGELGMVEHFCIDPDPPGGFYPEFFCEPVHRREDGMTAAPGGRSPLGDPCKADIPEPAGVLDPRQDRIMACVGDPERAVPQEQCTGTKRPCHGLCDPVFDGIPEDRGCPCPVLVFQPASPGPPRNSPCTGPGSPGFPRRARSWRMLTGLTISWPVPG